MYELRFHNPAGKSEQSFAHAARLPSLRGRKIGIISNGQWQSFRSLPALKRRLEEMFEGVEVLPVDAFPVGTELIGRDETIAAVKASGVDAVVVGNAACGACSAACAVAASKLELNGIPTVTVVREEFAGVVSNTASGLGLPPDLPMVTFPVDLFLPDSDLGPLERRAEEIFDKLVAWSPRLPNAEDAAMITVEGRDYRDADA